MTEVRWTYQAGENENYGWLSPAGRFYPVDWGQHDSWAWEHIRELVDSESLTMKERISSAGMGDVLMNRGWVLLHNPRANAIMDEA